MTHFIAGLGTSGTFIGTARRLKAYDARVRCISMQPDMPLHGLEGMKHMATAVVPGIYDVSVADEEVVVGSYEAQDMARRLAREEGCWSASAPAPMSTRQCGSHARCRPGPSS